MMDTSLLVFILAIVHHAQGSQMSDSTRVCVYTYKIEHLSIHNADDDESSEDYGAADIQGSAPEQTQTCMKASNFCYALWKEEGNVTSILGQGCWEMSGKADCHQSSCVANKKPSKALNNAKFCCCNTDLCNMNVSVEYVASEGDDPHIEPPATEFLEQPVTEKLTWIVPLVCVGTLVMVVVGVFVYRLCRGSAMGMCKPAPDAVHLMENGGTSDLHSGTYALEHLKLSVVVGQGRFGSVWKGAVGDQEVAVKIFPSHYRNYFYNERDIYCLPFMESPSLLTYYDTACGQPRDRTNDK